MLYVDMNLYKGYPPITDLEEIIQLESRGLASNAGPDH